MSAWKFTPSVPFMFFGTDVNGNHVYRVYNDPRKFVALKLTDAEQIEVNRTIDSIYTKTVNRKVGSQYMFLDHSKIIIPEVEEMFVDFKEPIFQMLKGDSQ